MKSEKLTFINHDGLQLAARIEFPMDQRPLAYVILAHCFTCNKNLSAVRNISKSLTSKGLAVLRFDFAGLGESEGDFVESNFSTNITDIVAAAEYLEKTYESPSLIIGHSLGGAAAIVAASKLPYVMGVATIGTPADPKHVTSLIQGAIKEIEIKGTALVEVGGRPFTIAKHFLDDLKNQNLEEVIKSLRKALLVLHSPIDRVVGIDNARLIYQAAHHPKSFVSLDGADHILTDKADSSYVGDMIASWASRYLSRSEQKSLETNSQVVASLDDESMFTTQMKAGVHRLTADEPPEVGGNDFGPSPYEFVSAGLAACTVMTLQMYARRKKWNLQEIRVHVDHHKIYAEDCKICISEENGDASEKRQKIDKIDRTLELFGNLDAVQRSRLLEIANRCPVHRTLESKSFIETKLVEEQ